jgi:peptidyl-prolyl cis-trans isomerase SurA
MRLLIVVFLVAGIAALAPLSWAGDVVDRIVATVNGQIILQSDWEDALRYQALVDNQALGSVGLDRRKAALDHLIDQELLKQQMQSSDFRHASEEEVAKRIEEIRKQYPDAVTENGWKTRLDKYGISEAELRHRAALEIDLTRLVDAHLRPTVSIDSKSIESYYNQELLPQLRQSGAAAVPLAQVTPQIKELLTEQKVNELLVAWLQTLRSGSEIRTDTEPHGGGGTLQ